MEEKLATMGIELIWATIGGVALIAGVSIAWDCRREIARAIVWCWRLLAAIVHPIVMFARGHVLQIYVTPAGADDDDPAVLPGSEPERSTGSTAFTRHGTERTTPFAAEPTDEPDEPALVIMPDQVDAVRAMIDYALGESRRGEKPSKTRRIQAGFKVGRGASPRYQQASTIYDILFGEPAPAVKYRPLDEQARPILQEEPTG